MVKRTNRAGDPKIVSGQVLTIGSAYGTRWYWRLVILFRGRYGNVAVLTLNNVYHSKCRQESIAIAITEKKIWRREYVIRCTTP